MIVAILAAQYESGGGLPRFDASDVTILGIILPLPRHFFTELSLPEDDDSDNESDVSSDSDATIEDNLVQFIDVAIRPSAVRCKTSPSVILEHFSRWTKSSEYGVYASTPLIKSVIDGDLEAFKNIAALYDVLPEIPIPDVTLNHILVHDRADILDEYIQRTGFGIDIPVAPMVDDPDIEKIYNRLEDLSRLVCSWQKAKGSGEQECPDSQCAEPITWLRRHSTTVEGDSKQIR